MDRDCYILGTRVDASTYEETIEQLLEWAHAGESRYVCVANVHMVMEAYDDPAFRSIVNGADFVTADGMPLVWVQRILGFRNARRVYGPDLTPLLCEAAARERLPVAFYGATPEVREAMVASLRRTFPGLQVAYSASPPFTDLSMAEEREVVEAINASGARIVFVGLGCPKQERWMARNAGRIHAVMLGVGAAFDFIAGAKPKAPPVLQSVGLEWLFRLLSEPRRLWKRYAYHNPRFVVGVTRELLHRSLPGGSVRAWGLTRNIGDSAARPSRELCK